MNTMRTAVLAGLCFAGLLSPARGETFGNFTTMGVIVDCPKGKAAGDIARVRAYLVEEGKRKPVHDLVQVGSFNYFAGSLFFLKPDTQYTVDVEFCDKDGKVIFMTTERGRTRREPVISATSKSVYVSPAGSDGGPGTIDKPLKTLKAGFARLDPGTTLFIRGGTYYEGELAPAAGGRPDDPVVIRNYNGEKVVIDGAAPELVDGGWKDDGQSNGDRGKEPGRRGVKARFTAQFKGRTWAVSFEDKATGKYYRLYPLRTLKELEGRMSAGKTFEQLGFTGAYHCDGNEIHAETPGKDIAEYRCCVSRFTRGVVLEGKSHVSIDGIEFRHFGQGDYGSAINILNSSSVLVSKCKVYYCNSGVWVKGNSSLDTVQDSIFVDDANHWHFTYTKTGDGWNYHGQIETGAVVVDGEYSGRGLVFRRNRVEGIFDGSHLCPWVRIDARTSETDWYENTLVDIADDFVETDGVSRNVRIFDNYMDKSLSGISLAQALDGPTWMLYNVIANCGVCAASTNKADYPYEGYPFKTNGGPSPEVGSGPVFFYHNTVYTTDPLSRALLVKSQAKWKVMALRNNIWYGKAMGFDCWNEKPSLMDWDYDDVYHAAGPFLKLQGFGQCRTLTDFQKSFGSLLQGISAEPKFRDAPGGDYHLAPASPCIDAGVPVEGINDTRIWGKAPDMGAFEWRPAAGRAQE